MSFETSLELSATQSWHRGQLRSLTYTASEDKTELVLELSVFRGQQLKDAEVRCFRFVDVEDIVVSTDNAELQRRDLRPGNITQGRLNDSHRLDLSVYLTGGYIRVVAQDIDVEPTPR